MLLIVRRANFFIFGVLGGVACSTGVCDEGFTFSADLPSVIICPEKIGSRMFALSDGSTIFFLRLAELS